ncbi:Serine-rich adhesin for platelets-like [Oopsacas minuta]|uniref:Serine-rich adhesin for platelets-like n=1 Tax=Oopsacas minuta TaxID=111878 RepID=A0AAV7K9V4_9METZ|nr:Serine-rich adhesin for platelets-like [Oopsacas minuta]
MGCGSSKSTQLIAHPINSNSSEVKEDTIAIDNKDLIHVTSPEVRTPQEIPETIQVSSPQVVNETVSQENTHTTPVDTQIHSGVHNLIEPPNDVTNNTSDEPTIEELLPSIIETINVTEFIPKDCLDFNSLWSYNCAAISDKANVLTVFDSEEPFTLKWCHIVHNDCELIPFWVNNASKLEAIDLSDNHLGPEGFRAVLLALGCLPNLKSVNISSNNADSTCSASIQAFLAKSNLLEELDISCNELSGCSIGRDLASGLQIAGNIVHLNISGCGLSDIEPLFQIESHCDFIKTVRRLDLSHNPINSRLFSDTIEGFISKVQLEYLNIKACELSSHAISRLTLSLLNNSSLLKLNTSANKFSDKASLIQLVTVCMLQGLITELIISNITYAEDKDSRVCQENTASLIKEKLEGTSVTSYLKKLTLSSCKLDGRTLQLLRFNMLATKVYLSELDLSSNVECVPENIRRFALGKKPEENILSVLDKLTDGANTGDNLIGLMRDGIFPSLKRLSLIHSIMSPNKVGNLSEFICKIETDSNETGIDTPQLTELILDGIKLSGTNRSAIVNLFNSIIFLQDSSAKVNWSLTSLSLNSCSLNDSDVKPLSQALTHGLCLEYLSLAYNRLGDNAVADLVEGLTYRKTLKTINLSNNRINSNGATILADCLSRLEVERVEVAGNLIGPDGVLALINLTRICSGLKYIDLRDQKSEFPEQYLQLYHSNIMQVIESRLSQGSMKPLVVMKMYGVGEYQNQNWEKIDSLNIETNIRKYKATTLGLWECITLIYCFNISRNPRIQRSRKKYTQAYQSMREGIGEIQLTSGEWKEVIGSSESVPSWLFIEEYREKGVYVSCLHVTATQEKLAVIFEVQADCRVVEVVMCKDSEKYENFCSAWVLFEDWESVINAVNYYKNGLASFYAQPYIITPLAVKVIGTDIRDTRNLDIVRAEIAQRAYKNSVIRK